MLPATCGWASVVGRLVLLLPLWLLLAIVAAAVVVASARVVRVVPIVGNFHSFRFVPI